MPTKDLIDSLFPKARQFVLMELLLADKPIHQRELARRTGLHPKTIQAETENLISSEIVFFEKSGNQKLYTINKDCQLYSELLWIIMKTIGVTEIIRRELEPFRDRIHKAYIYGNFVPGTFTYAGKVEVMIVGDLSMRDINIPMSNATVKLRRPIEAAAYGVNQYYQKLLDNDFIKRINVGKKIMLIGD